MNGMFEPPQFPERTYFNLSPTYPSGGTIYTICTDLLKVEAARALAHMRAMHRAGVLHSDINASIIMRRPGQSGARSSQICLVDFSYATLNSLAITHMNIWQRS